MERSIYILEAQASTFFLDDDIIYESEFVNAIIVFDGNKFYDYKNGEEVFELNFNPYGEITNDLYENTVYVRNIKRISNVDSKMLSRAIEIVNYNDFLNQLKEEKKLIPFPQKLLH